MTADSLTATGLRVPALPQLHVTEYESRVAALRGEMRRHDLAGVVLAGPESIYHLLGLDHLGYFALTLLVVPLEGQPVVVARAALAPGAATRAVYGAREDAVTRGNHVNRCPEVPSGPGPGVELDRDRVERYPELHRSKGAAEFSFQHPDALNSAPALPKF